MNLDFVRFQIIPHKNDRGEANHYEIKFVKNLKLFTMMIHPGEEFEQLRKKLEEMCIRTDFFKKYMELDLIEIDNTKMVKNL